MDQASDSNTTNSQAAEEDRFDGGDLCPACLAELDDGCGFCPKCGAPVEPTSAVAPFERILAEGYVYRRAVAEPRSLVVVIGALLVFAPFAIFGLLFVRRAIHEAGRVLPAAYVESWNLGEWLTGARWMSELLGGLFLVTIGLMGAGQAVVHYWRRSRTGGVAKAEL